MFSGLKWPNFRIEITNFENDLKCLQTGAAYSAVITFYFVYFRNCSVPNLPEVEGENEFSGHMIHSIRYRHPELFEGQTVAVLGRSYSAIDISSDLSKHAKQVI